MARVSDASIKRLPTYQVKEYTALKKLIRKEGIVCTCFTVYKAQPNDMVKTYNRNTQDKMRGLLYDVRAGRRFWGDPALYKAHLNNSTPTSLYEGANC